MIKQFNVVVIDDNAAVLSSVRKQFKNKENINIIETFNDGKKGMNYLLDHKESYDLVILDILLPNIDGIKILEELKRNNIDKKIMVLSSFKDDYTIKKIQQLNANYYMLKPIDMDILENRIEDLMDSSNKISIPVNGAIEVKVSSLLHELGIPSHVRGYKYIREGILMLYGSDSMVTLVTKEIYPEIAQKYETTASRVERAIRHAIEISWIRGDLKLMEEIFGNSIDFEKSKPTNSEFLTTIADLFKLNHKELIG